MVVLYRCDIIHIVYTVITIHIQRRYLYVCIKNPSKIADFVAYIQTYLYIIYLNPKIKRLVYIKYKTNTYVVFGTLEYHIVLKE